MIKEIRKCRICGRKDTLTKHHLISKSELKKLGINEGLTIDLCKHCHAIFHGHRPWISVTEKLTLRCNLRNNLTVFEIGYIVRVAGNDYLRKWYPIDSRMVNH